MATRTHLSFDQRNADDYQKISNSIREALATIEKDKSLRATGVTLAKIAGCSRGALYHREWVIPELERIKTLRTRSTVELASSEVVANKDEASDINSLEKLLKNYRSDNCRLFYLYEQLKEANRQKDEIISILERKLKETAASKLCSENGSNNVIQICRPLDSPT